MLLDDRERQSQVLLRPPRGWRTRVLALVLFLAAQACTHRVQPAVFTCPSEAKRGIYSPKRLTVLGACRWFRGTVTETDRKDDGDMHLLLQPDPGYSDFLNVENVNGGAMVVEIVPGQQLPVPGIGEHIEVYGTWVLDEHNGWNEIHPVWGIRYLDRGLAAAALPPASPQYEGSSND